MEQTTRTENVARRERKAKRLADKLSSSSTAKVADIRSSAPPECLARSVARTSAWTRSNANLRCGSSEDPTAVKVIRFEFVAAKTRIVELVLLD